jgi:hypothetical protein
MNTSETEHEKLNINFRNLGDGAHYLTKENRDVCGSQLGYICQEWLP